MHSIIFIIFTLLLSLPALADTLTPQRKNELLELLHQDCGSCHGMRLTGGLGPALTASALKNKPIEIITLAISEGRPNTPMPPWKNLLSKADINWLAHKLKQQSVTQR